MDVCLIRSKVQCNSCGHDMTWYAAPNIPAGNTWRYRRRVVGKRCSGSKSIRHGSWAQHSHHTLHDVLYITYDILRRERAKQIQHEHHFSDHTISNVVRSAKSHCWYTWRAGLRRSAVLTRRLRSTRVSSVGENTIGDIE